MDRIVHLCNIYNKSANELTKSRDDWKGLLSSMARYYKYSFDNNVLIYAQRPDAGMLATIEVWNKKIGRAVNKGTKGLAVIDMSNPKASLKFLFDLLDTNGSYESLRHVMNLMWELEDQYKPEIITRLHDKYGADKGSIESCIFDFTKKRATENLTRYLKGFRVADPDSMLSKLPVEAVKEQFAELTIDSIEYLVFKKCGLSTDMFEEDCFENISHFNSMWLFTRMGSIIMSIARPILREIYMEIENIKYERSKNNELETFNRPDLLRGRGRADVSQHSNIGGRGRRLDGSGQIRQDVEGIYGGTIPVPYNGIDHDGKIQQDGDGSRRGSREPERETDTGASESSAHAGRGRPAGKSGPHEHDLSNGGRNHHQRVGIENKITQQNPSESNETLSGGFSRSEINKPAHESGESENIAGKIETLQFADPIDEGGLSKLKEKGLEYYTPARLEKIRYSFDF